MLFCRGTKPVPAALTSGGPTPSMIFSAIILSLLSLLVATDPEPAGPSLPPSPEPPLRPVRKPSLAKENRPQSEQIAA